MGKVMTREHRRKISAARTAWWAGLSQEKRADIAHKMSVGVRARWRDPEFRERMLVKLADARAANLERLRLIREAK